MKSLAPAMLQRIDLHCHILPGVDDGPQDLDNALGMARMAVADGTGLLVATPHFQPGTWDTTLDQVARAAALFREALQREDIDLELRWAGEVRLGPEVLGRLRRRDLPCLDPDRRFLLLEFPHPEIPPGALYQVELLRLAGYSPVIVHPERNGTIRKRPGALRPFVELGCRFQITAGSLCGEFGSSAQAAARALLERGWVDVIASDGHSFYRRHPVLADGLREATRLVGETAARRLVIDTPRAILEGTLPS
ncbi:MAG: capsular biosynthesis protein [Magnetococcales bacterium]|nr:capsular biosynthesis protein [Magnetococcales bacterium]